MTAAARREGWERAYMTVPGRAGTVAVERRVVGGVAVAVWAIPAAGAWGWARHDASGWRYGSAWSRNLAVRAALWA